LYAASGFSKLNIPQELSRRDCSTQVQDKISAQLNNYLSDQELKNREQEQKGWNILYVKYF
jgi:hypothetical protein